MPAQHLLRMFRIQKNPARCRVFLASYDVMLQGGITLHGPQKTHACIAAWYVGPGVGKKAVHA